MLKRFVLALALAATLAVPVSMAVDATSSSAYACGARGICQQQ